MNLDLDGLILGFQKQAGWETALARGAARAGARDWAGSSDDGLARLLIGALIGAGGGLGANRLLRGEKTRNEKLLQDAVYGGAAGGFAGLLTGS